MHELEVKERVELELKAHGVGRSSAPVDQGPGWLSQTSEIRQVSQIVCRHMCGGKLLERPVNPHELRTQGMYGVLKLSDGEEVAFTTEASGVLCEVDLPENGDRENGDRARLLVIGGKFQSTNGGNLPQNCTFCVSLPGEKEVLPGVERKGGGAKPPLQFSIARALAKPYASPGGIRLILVQPM